MITLTKREIPNRDSLDIPGDELASEWRKTKECFDQARAQKIETDRIYVAAATRLNALDRLVKQVEQREAVARRAAAKTLVETAKAGVLVRGK